MLYQLIRKKIKCWFQNIIDFFSNPFEDNMRLKLLQAIQIFVLLDILVHNFDEQSLTVTMKTVWLSQQFDCWVNLVEVNTAIL